MPLIGFAGPARSGKTYMANRVKEHIEPGRSTIISFADPIKDMLSVLIGFDAKDDSVKELPHKNLCNQTVRKAMQTLGTEWGRDLVGQDIWINALERRIKLTGASVVLIPDVRFDSEAEMIFKNGGKVFYISPNKDLYTEINESKHVSESSLSKEVLDKCIHFVNNFDEASVNFVLNNYRGCSSSRSRVSTVCTD